MTELKLFTLEEANRLLPQVCQILKVLRALRDQVQKLEERRAIEELSWLKEDGTVSPRAQKEVTRLQRQIDLKGKVFEEELKKLNELGAQLKGLEEGLVDFLAQRQGELICLCWKEGEDRIRHWHDLESGFTGRRPVEEL